MSTNILTKDMYILFLFFSPSSSNRSLVTKFVNGNLLMSSMTMKKDDYQHNAKIICYIALHSSYLETTLITPHLHKEKSTALLACLLKLA